MGVHLFSVVLVTVLVGELGDGGVFESEFDCEFEGEFLADRENVGLRGGGSNAVEVGGVAWFMAKVDDVATTEFEFDRRKRDLRFFFLGCLGGAETLEEFDDGRLSSGSSTFCVFEGGGDAAVFTMSGFCGRGLAGRTSALTSANSS